MNQKPLPADSQAGRCAWLVSPGFDLLFVSNVLWPLALIPWLGGEHGTPLSFWQLYFLTTPHRWATLLLVATDPDRREGRGKLFVGIALAFGVVVGGDYLWTGAFLCLALVDFVWNSWHFASQHAGVLRMYSRKVGGGSAWLERHGLRLFIFYSALRLAGWTTGWLDSDPDRRELLRTLDLLLLTLPVALLAVQIRGWSRLHVGKGIYLFSVCALYVGLLLSVRNGYTPLTVALTIASAIFHATEYLAVVTHYARRRCDHGSVAPFQWAARNWRPVLFGFILALGAFESSLGKDSGPLWIGLNLWAAFLHYAYDGMIWKLRRPATAAVLGVTGGAPASGGPRL